MAVASGPGPISNPVPTGLSRSLEDKASGALGYSQAFAIVRDRVVRTTGVLEFNCSQPSRWAADAAERLATAHPGAAGGKVTVVDVTHRPVQVRVYQVHAGEVRLCACANATASALAALGPAGISVVDLVLPARKRCLVQDVSGGATGVHMVWTTPLGGDARFEVLPPASIAPSAFGLGCGLFNRYAVAMGPAEKDFVNDVWTTCSGTGVDRLVVLEMDRELPRLLFRGPRDVHPSIPLTGGMTVALLGHSLPAFARLRGQSVLTPLGLDILPHVDTEGGHLVFTLPAVSVQFLETPANPLIDGGDIPGGTGIENLETPWT